MRIFIGYDSKEAVAYHVLSQSILSQSAPVSITPLVLNHLSVFTRDNQGTTEFSLTRFLVPYLSDYKGWSLFMDCDMLCRTDINDIMKFSGNDDVYVCKHDYVPKTTVKATGAQTTYPRKNWSSVMLFNNELCRELTPEYVNSATPAQLHRMEWAKSIGDIPLEWNWLVGEYESNPTAKILHYTLGTPCFDGYQECDHAEEWFEMLKKATTC